MKDSRVNEISALASNLDIILKENDKKFIAFTTDSLKYNIMTFVGEIATAFIGKKVAIMSYGEMNCNTDNAVYINIDNNMSKDDVLSKADGYDVVLVICPNMLTSKNYLHMANFVSDIVFVAKKWQSKLPAINNMKALACDANMNVLGVVYNK